MAEINHSRYGRINVKRHFRAKYVRLSVSAGGELSVSAPLYTPLHFIKNFIRSSAAEIDKMLARSQITYRHGMQIGKSHRLELVAADELKVEYKKPKILVYAAGHEELETHELQQLIKPVVAKALRAEAKAYLPRRLAYLAEQGGFSYKKIHLSHAKSRWGSCSNENTISLNIALMKLDFELIDYVILHELAHTQELNHSPKFWQLVEAGNRQYKQHRKELKKHSPHL